MIEGLVSGKAAERGLQHCRICFKPGKDNISGKDNGVTDLSFTRNRCVEALSKRVAELQCGSCLPAFAQPGPTV